MLEDCQETFLYNIEFWHTSFPGILDRIVLLLISQFWAVISELQLTSLQHFRTRFVSVSHPYAVSPWLSGY